MLLRSLVQLEDGGGTEFFGEPQLEIGDLIRTAADGRGMITCLELAAVQDKPALFSTVLMWILAELFEQLPEVGDLDKPKLVFFFDEAHLLFDGATKSFLDSVTRTVRMIRSKGVGVFFVTQQPTDLPAEVLGQLGARVQHALRAFTPEDADALKKTVRTYPTSDFYDLGKLLTEVGTGRGGRDDPLRKGRADTCRAHTAAGAAFEHDRVVERRAGREGVAALHEVRHQARARQRRGAACEAGRGRPDGAAQAPHRRGASAKAAKPAGNALTDFLGSRQGKALQKEVVRGAFSLLRKRL